MLHNDNKFDQQLRDRLRDHSSPVRGDLWRRIHPGIPAPARQLRSWRALRSWPSLRYLGVGAATLVAAIAAAHYLYVHNARKSAPAANHYSTIRPAATSDTNAAAQSSATPKNTANLFQSPQP